MFDLKVISKDRMIFNKPVSRVRVQGEESDYELMSFHADIAGILMKGQLVIDNRFKLFIKSGLVSFHNNRCIILVVELRRKKKKTTD